MNMAEAIAHIESRFIVHEEIGYLTDYRDSNDKLVADGPRDWSRAPNGESYDVLTSGGLQVRAGEVSSIMFGDEGRAWQWWVWAVEDYAEEVAPRAEWAKLHLYWRTKPEWASTEYVALHQAELLGSHSEAPLHVDLGLVYSRLLISKKNPDGKSDV